MESFAGALAGGGDVCSSIAYYSVQLVHDILISIPQQDSSCIRLYQSYISQNPGIPHVEIWNGLTDIGFTDCWPEFIANHFGLAQNYSQSLIPS
jgi:hypothetical protein